MTAFVSAGLLLTASAKDGNWGIYRDERFGFILVFPADVFNWRGQSQNGNGAEFISRDGRAKLNVFAAFNTDKAGLIEYREAVLRGFAGYDKLEYGPLGQSWFVLSGARDLSIYYQKVLFACGGRIINAFALTYPKEQKREYDAIVTGIEKKFRSTSGSACYVPTR
ncbi:MAG: hypothetical protein WBX25_22150 [Rhodomicrobium sp.]